MNQPHALYLRVVENIPGSLGIALLRIMPPRPGAARPARVHCDTLGGREQLPTNASKSGTQGCALGGIQLRNRVVCLARQVDASVVIRVGVAHAVMQLKQLVLSVETLYARVARYRGLHGLKHALLSARDKRLWLIPM